MIYNIYFIHNVHEDSLQLFIDPIGFTVERISNFVISRNCSGVGFGRNFEQNKLERYLNFYCDVPVGTHLGSVVPLSF